MNTLVKNDTIHAATRRMPTMRMALFALMSITLVLSVLSPTAYADTTAHDHHHHSADHDHAKHDTDEAEASTQSEFTQPINADDAEVLIVASIAPLHSIVLNLLPEHITPRLLLDAHQSPHTTKLKPSQRQALAKADVFIYLDEQIELFLADTLKQMPKSQQQLGVYAAVKGTLDNNNPHIWLSPKYVAAMAERIQITLISALPEHKTEIRARYAAFIETLDYLDIAIRRQFADITVKPYVVYHNAYEAFEQHYGLAHASVIAYTDNHHGGNLSIKRINGLKSLMAEEGVACIYLEPQVNNKKLRRLLNSDGKIQMLTLDPLGSEIALGEQFITQLLSRVAAAFRQCV